MKIVHFCKLRCNIVGGRLRNKDDMGRASLKNHPVKRMHLQNWTCYGSDLLLQWPFSDNILRRWCINLEAECHSCWLTSHKLVQLHFLKFSQREREDLSLQYYICWERLKKEFKLTNSASKCHSCWLISHNLHKLYKFIISWIWMSLLLVNFS